VRIVHVTDSYQPVLGGIENHVAALAARQAARGDNVTVLTCTTADDEGDAISSGDVEVRRARTWLDAWWASHSGFDVVHAHVSVVSPFSAPFAGRAARAGIPTVVTVHSFWNAMGPIPRAAATLSGLRSAPVVWTAVSRAAARHVSRRLPGQPPVRVVPNAVHVFPRSATPQRSRNDPLRIVSTMRIARRKRPHHLLRIFDALTAATSIPVELVIVGDGPLRASIQRQAARTASGRVSITGRLRMDDVLRVLGSADVYAAPALLESFGLAALEARCVGLPVVGHAGSGMADFIEDGVEGFLCRSDAAMTVRLRQLVEDEELRMRISEHNRTTAPLLTWETAMDCNDAAYAASGAVPAEDVVPAR
jgi:glycosyltransferase involved in cell wall biosynthesis